MPKTTNQALSEDVQDEEILRASSSPLLCSDDLVLFS